MKRLLLSLAILLALPLVFSSLAHADFSRWKVEMSDPTTSDQLRSFNIEFTALTVEDTTITVRLIENGTQIGDDRVTPSGGGSGVFHVTVPEDGVYAYHLRSTSNSETRNTETRNVRVSTVDDETTIEVDPELTPEEEAQLIQAQTGQPVAGTQVGDGEATDADGEITDEAAVTDEDENGDVLGVDDDEDDEDDGTGAILRNILIVIALLGVMYYIFFRKRGNES